MRNEIAQQGAVPNALRRIGQLGRVCQAWHRAYGVRLRLSSIRSELMAEGSRSQVPMPGFGDLRDVGQNIQIFCLQSSFLVVISKTDFPDDNFELRPFIGMSWNNQSANSTRIESQLSVKPFLVAFSHSRLTLRAFPGEGFFFLSMSCATQ